MPRIDAFIPILQTAIIVNDLITASLLFSQFLIVRQRALSVLASGYLFSALMVVPYTLTFPGAFAPDGLLGAGLQSTPWLYFFWHVGLPLAVIAYALLKDADDRIGKSLSPPAVAIGLSIAAVITVVVGLTLLSTRWDSLLPKIMLDSVRVNLDVRPWYGGVLQSLAIAALAVILFTRRSVLDLWLTVMCCAWVLELLLGTTFVSARFSLGWYASRIFSLAAAITVLIVLLSETTTLYAHLARSVARRRQAREMRQAAMDVMAASIAHEISQPLTGLIANAVDAMRGVSGRPRHLRVGSNVTPDQSKVEISVEDSGMGVSQNDLNRIFEPFFTTKPAGTGIGLAICRSIIEAHGGELLASVNIPHGMIFRINLPVHAL